MSSTSRRHYSNNNDLEAGGSQIGESERLIGPDVIEMQPLISRISRVKAHDRGTEAEKIFRRAEEERANGHEPFFSASSCSIHNINRIIELKLLRYPSRAQDDLFVAFKCQERWKNLHLHLPVVILQLDGTSLLYCQGITMLQHCWSVEGQVKGLSDSLKTNLEEGIKGDNDDLLKRKYEFGPNIYPWKKGRSFWMFLWDAWQNPTLIILIVVAVASLALGIKTQEGWYDGGSIAFAVMFVIVVKAISDYIQSLQIQSLNEEKRNIHLQVIRSGRRIEISIYDIVVGDVVPLNIGDRIPANGVLITGHSLAIDESSMTRERKIVHKDSRDPFLFSGFKVADGSGTMLVTSVGINADWGNHRANISEDTVEETPLQVTIVLVAVPKGLPLAVPLTLAYAMRKMMADKAL
ncbi:calcium-transporting atpase 10, partial [Quercus suber]